MIDKIDVKKSFDPKRGVMMSWDSHGNVFISMPVNNIPKKQFEDWIQDCNLNYSGKRWDKILSDHIKARAYELMTNHQPEEQPVKESEEVNAKNPLGLMNGGSD